MKCMLIVLLLTFTSMLCAVVANHIPPAGFGAEQATELRVEIIQGIDEIYEAAIMYRIQDSETFQSIIMDRETPDSYWFRGSLPVTSAPDKAYEYYFKFTLNSGIVETMPVIEPEQHLFIVQPKAKAGDLSEDFILLSEQDAISARDGFIIAVSWYALEGLFVKNSINLYINGKNVTKRAEVGSFMLLYKDANPKPGVTTYYVTARTADGQDIFSKTWMTVIKASGQINVLPMNLRGTFNTGTNIFTTANDSTAYTFGSDRDDGWANLEMYGDYKDLQLRSYTYLSTLQNEDTQNVNKFRLGVLLPYWETYIGDYSPFMGNLTMSNRNIRGFYTRIHSRNVSWSFAHGEVVRKTDGNETTNPITKEVEYSAGVFKQEAIASRIQFGQDKGFYMGFTTTRNRDIISSLDSKYILKTTATDITQMVFPKDNLVLSMDARLTIPAQNIVLGFEGAGSLYNNNTLPGPMTKDELSDYIGSDVDVSPETFQDIFIFNTNMQPLPMSKDFDDPTSFIAWQAYLRNFYWNNMINLSYTQVGPSFRALSTSYMQNDATQWLISDQYTYKQYLFVSGGVSQIKDNLTKTKMETNTYNNFYSQIMFRYPKYPYLLLAYTKSSGKNEVNDEIVLTDSTLYSPYKRNSNVFSLGLGHDFDMLPIAPTSVDIGWRTGTDDEKRAVSGKSLDKLYEFGTDNIYITFSSRFIEFPLKTQLTISNSIQDNVVEKEKNNNFNYLMRGEYWLMQNRIKPWAEYRITALGGDQDQQSYNYVTFGVDARPFVNTNVSSSLGWQIYNNNDQQNVDYTTTAWHLSVTQRF